jgi:hypothetical protein
VVVNCAGLYYGELFTEQAAAELDKALEQAKPEEKLDILLASRVLYALLQPNKCEFPSNHVLLASLLLSQCCVSAELADSRVTAHCYGPAHHWVQGDNRTQ